MKKVYTAAVGAQVALDLLQKEKTLAQISAEYGVHANVLRDWPTQALKGLPTKNSQTASLAGISTLSIFGSRVDSDIESSKVSGIRRPLGLISLDTPT